MLHYAVVFFIIALIAALFGFTGLAGAAAGIAQILFVVFMILTQCATRHRLAARAPRRAGSRRSRG